MFLENEKSNLSKKDRKERHKLLEWFNKDYSEYPSVNDILMFVSKHNEIINTIFCDKVVIPCLNNAINRSNIEDIRLIFEANSFTNNINCFNLTNNTYSPINLIDLVLSHNPQHKITLNYKYRLLKNRIEYSIHEVSIGVFPDDD